MPDKETPTKTHNLSHLKDFRRDLRSYGTPAEAALWKRLKGRQVEGLMFRRQFSVGNAILDFYCPALRLALELDGQVHNNSIWGQRQEDFDRDSLLLSGYGITVLRYENRTVFEHPDYLLDDIRRFAQGQRSGLYGTMLANYSIQKTAPSKTPTLSQPSPTPPLS